MNEPESSVQLVFNNRISVKVAAFHSGCNLKYLRRLLRDGQPDWYEVGTNLTD